jgi:dipeptidyl aminopeptidase/acylaminoacyl peptidase
MEEDERMHVRRCGVAMSVASKAMEPSGSWGADGSGQGQLTQGYDDTAPDWSADGEWLVFSRRGTLYTMRKDGEQVRSLQVEGLLPDWAPLPE